MFLLILWSKRCFFEFKGTGEYQVHATESSVDATPEGCSVHVLEVVLSLARRLFGICPRGCPVRRPRRASRLAEQARMHIYVQVDLEPSRRGSGIVGCGSSER